MCHVSCVIRDTDIHVYHPSIESMEHESMEHESMEHEGMEDEGMEDIYFHDVEESEDAEEVEEADEVEEVEEADGAEEEDEAEEAEEEEESSSYFDITPFFWDFVNGCVDEEMDTGLERMNFTSEFESMREAVESGLPLMLSLKEGDEERLIHPSCLTSAPWGCIWDANVEAYVFDDMNTVFFGVDELILPGDTEMLRKFEKCLARMKGSISADELSTLFSIKVRSS
jgi:hypothetical protein